MKTIEVKDPAVEGVPENLREVIGEKVTYRLAQQPGSYVVLKYVRPVVKRKDNLAIVTASAPEQVLERTTADVSFLAGMVTLPAWSQTGRQTGQQDPGAHRRGAPQAQAPRYLGSWQVARAGL